MEFPDRLEYGIRAVSGRASSAANPHCGPTSPNPASRTITPPLIVVYRGGCFTSACATHIVERSSDTTHSVGVGDAGLHAK